MQIKLAVYGGLVLLAWLLYRRRSAPATVGSVGLGLGEFQPWSDENARLNAARGVIG